MGESDFWRRRGTLTGCHKPSLLSPLTAKCVLRLPGSGLVSYVTYVRKMARRHRIVIVSVFLKSKEIFF